MCGRFVSSSGPDELANYFSAEPPKEALEASYNVAPTNEVYAVRADDGHRAIATLRWGLVPFWAKDLKIGQKMINARSETVATKPSFRAAYKRRRCLIPADGFYEWAKVEGAKRKQPYFIYRPDGEPLVVAGLWESWRPKDDEDGEEVISCTLLTCAANDVMSPVHDRMPVLLPPGVWDQWLDPETDVESLADLLIPAPNELLTMHPVTTMVNSVRNKGAALVTEAALDQLIVPEAAE